MKVGDLVKLWNSERKNSKFAGKIGIVVSLDSFQKNPVVNVDGELRSFHCTQVEEVISGS